MSVTRDDVARVAGVSSAVVSYVVNNGPRQVSPRTRQRVEAAIEQLDYKPNLIAGALRRGRTRTIGMLAPRPTNPFIAESASSVEDALVKLKYSLTIAITTEDARRTEMHLESLRSRRVDGLLVLDAAVVPAVDAAGWDPAHVVVMDQVGETAPFASVHLDNDASSRAAVHYLQQLGHRVIGLVAGPRSSRTAVARVEGWRSQLCQGGVEPGEDLVAYVDWTAAGGDSAAEALVGEDGRPFSLRRERPSALVVSSDVQAFGVLSACYRMGLHVPGDLSLVSIDGTQLASHSAPPLTTIRQPYEQITNVAMEILRGRAHVRGVMAHALPGNLVIGGTSAPVA